MLQRYCLNDLERKLQNCQIEFLCRRGVIFEGMIGKGPRFGGERGEDWSRQWGVGEGRREVLCRGAVQEHSVEAELALAVTGEGTGSAL